MKVSRTLYSILISASVLILAACGGEEAPANAEGERIVTQFCVACHSTGLNGAPIVGNRKMWASRLPQGEQVLIQHAIEGYGLMPAKGGRTELSDEQIADAVRYLMSQVQP